MDPSDLRAGLAERLGGSDSIDAETLNATCFLLARALDGIEFSVDDAAPLIRRLLRVAGRVAIDAGTPGADAEVWPNTEAMVLLWIDEALQALGYEVRSAPGSARPELVRTPGA